MISKSFQTALSQYGGVLLVESLTVRCVVREIPDFGAIGQRSNDQERIRKMLSQFALQQIVVFAVECDPHGVPDPPHVVLVRKVRSLWQEFDAGQATRHPFGHRSSVSGRVGIVFVDRFLFDVLPSFPLGQ